MTTINPTVPRGKKSWSCAAENLSNKKKKWKVGRKIHVKLDPADYDRISFKLYNNIHNRSELLAVNFFNILLYYTGSVRELLLNWFLYRIYQI